MGFVYPPEDFTGVLETVKQVNIQVVRNQEKTHLHPNRPTAHQMKRRPVEMMLNRRDDIIEDQYLQKIALYNSVPYQVCPEPLPEKVQAFPVRGNAFPGNDEHRPASQYSSC